MSASDLIEFGTPLIVPEIEAIHTETLVHLEREYAERGSHVRIVPTTRAAPLTMDREGIRRLAAETLGLPTSPYRFVDTLEDYRAAVAEIGVPCVVKTVMSSSGKGQSLVRTADDINRAWDYVRTGGRAGAGRVIMEGFIDFDYEITLLTVRHAGGTDFCAPIGHLQRDGDYRESWQPQPMSARALEHARSIAKTITDDLGGWGLFGVELFVKGDAVWFSEVSPRPHDTGLVTLISQDLSQFALHARAILGLPVHADESGSIRQCGPSASCAVLAHGHGVPVFADVADALRAPDTALRLFGKPVVEGQRRVGVTLALALGEDIDAARSVARDSAAALKIELRCDCIVWIDACLNAFLNGLQERRTSSSRHPGASWDDGIVFVRLPRLPVFSFLLGSPYVSGDIDERQQWLCRLPVSTGAGSAGAGGPAVSAGWPCGPSHRLQYGRYRWCVRRDRAGRPHAGRQAGVAGIDDAQRHDPDGGVEPE